MHRLERLLNLVAALLDTYRPLTREAIKERVPGYAEDDAAFRRAFERDKDALRQMGIPVEVEVLEPDNADSPVGYRISREQYALPDPGLEPDELAALHLAANAVRLDSGSAMGALHKLGGATATAGTDVALATLPGSEHLPVLFAAITERRTTRFVYSDRERVVDPYVLSFRNGRWYLYGHDHDRIARRSFRLDRIESTPTVGDADAFKRPEGIDGSQPHPWQMGDDEPITARLRVDGEHADLALAELGAEALERRESDGGGVFTTTVTDQGAFRSFVLAFLDHAEILDPPEFRSDIVSWLEALASPVSGR